MSSAAELFILLRCGTLSHYILLFRLESIFFTRKAALKDRKISIIYTKAQTSHNEMRRRFLSVSNFSVKSENTEPNVNQDCSTGISVALCC